MLHINTNQKIRSIMASICVLFSVGLFAQSEKTSEKSTIVMTQPELESFLSMIADARRSVLNERKNKQQKMYLAELRLKHQNRLGIGSNAYENASYQNILRELRFLNERIDNLSDHTSPSTNVNRDKSIIIMPGNVTPNSISQPNERTTIALIPSNDKKIEELEKRIDSLKTINSNKEKDTQKSSYSDSLNLNEVRRQMDSLESKMKATDKAKHTKDAEEKTYFKRQVFFDNNSETVKAEFDSSIQDLAEILSNYPEAKVLIEGWASPLGKVDYNKQLSMRRAEAAKQAFIDKRIDEERIIISFKGEDNTSSEQYARRVDMSIIVR